MWWSKLRPLLVFLALAAFAEEPGKGSSLPWPERLKHPNFRVRFAAAMKPPESVGADEVKALIAALDDPDLRVRRAAVAGMFAIYDHLGPLGARALGAVLTKPFSGIQGDAATALAACGDDAYPVMREFLKSKDLLAATSPWRTFAGGEPARTKAIEFLRTALLREKDPVIRANAAGVLRRLAASIPPVLDDLWTVVLDDEAPAAVRAAAILGFARLSTSGQGRTSEGGETYGRDSRIVKAIPIVREMISDPDEGVKAAAREAADILEASGGRR